MKIISAHRKQSHTSPSDVEYMRVAEMDRDAIKEARTVELELDSGQVVEATQIHVTELATHLTGSTCKRRIQLSNFPDQPTLRHNPKQWVTVQGTLVHKALEYAIQGQPVPSAHDLLGPYTEFKENPFAQNALASHLSRLDDYLDLAKEIVPDLQECKTELQLLQHFPDLGVVLAGTMDVWDPTTATILDWKTGKTAQASAKVQMNIYRQMLSDQDDNPISMYLLLLGLDSPKAVRVKPEPVNIRSGLDSLYESIHALPRQPCTDGYMCKFCPYFGSNSCRGI